MALKFYESKEIDLPDGNKFEVTPATVEDMEEIMELTDVQNELKKLKKEMVKKIGKKMSKKEKEKEENRLITRFSTSKSLPIIWKLAQRCIKRNDPKNAGLSGKELDKIPDVPLAVLYAIKIATAMMDVSFVEGADTKKSMVEKSQAEKS